MRSKLKGKLVILSEEGALIRKPYMAGCIGEALEEKGTKVLVRWPDCMCGRERKWWEDICDIQKR